MQGSIPSAINIHHGNVSSYRARISSMWGKSFRLHKYDTGRLKSAAQIVIELNKCGQVYKLRWPRYEKSDANRNKKKTLVH